MFILFGHSIDNGMKFIGPFKDQAVINAVSDELDFNEEYERLASDYDWHVIELHNSLNEAKHYPETMTQRL